MGFPEAQMAGLQLSLKYQMLYKIEDACANDHLPGL